MNEKKNIPGANNDKYNEEILNWGDDSLFEGISGGDVPENRPVPLYGITPMLKYGVVRPPHTKKSGEKEPSEEDEGKQEGNVTKPSDQ